MLASQSLAHHKGVLSALATILYHLHSPELIAGGEYVLLCDDGSAAKVVSGLPQWDDLSSLPIDLYPLPLVQPDGSPARTAISTTLDTAKAVQEFLSKFLRAEQQLSSGLDS